MRRRDVLICKQNSVLFQFNIVHDLNFQFWVCHLHNDDDDDDDDDETICNQG